MSNKLILASLLTLSATSLAAPPALMKPVPASPWLEEVHMVEPSPQMNVIAAPTWDIVVDADGNWQRHDVDAERRQSTDRTGKLSSAQIKEIEDALAKARFTVTTNAITCHARTLTFDRFLVGGKNVWEEHTCQADSLDADSARAIATIRRVLDTATAKRTVWFEVDHKAETWAADVPTGSTTVYDDGTFEQHDADTRTHGATTTIGQLTADQISQLRAALAKATWNVRVADATCAAVGSTYETYSVGGKTVWTAHMCQAEYLDDASERAIELMDQLLTQRS
jgi:hypothetical protein